MATRMWTAAFIFLALTSRVSTQEHAPTVDACHADQAAWGNKQDQLEYARQELELSKNGTKDTSPAAAPSYEELLSRRREMITCANVDPLNVEKYIDVGNFYAQVAGDRFENFVVRHHLMQQFLHEDAAGVR
jgi:hypothetical protein